MVKFLSALTLTLAFVLVHSDGQRNYEITFSKFQCSHNSTLFKFFECSLRNGSSRQYAMDGRLELASDMEDFRIRTILIGYNRNMPPVTFYDITMNACQFLENIAMQKMLSLFLKTMKRYMNVVPRCPFRKDFNYTVTGFYYNAEDLPNYIPEVEFETKTYAFVKQKCVATVLSSGRVTHLVNANPKRVMNRAG